MDTKVSDGNGSLIPRLSMEELSRRFKQIKPVVYLENYNGNPGNHMYYLDIDLFNIADTAHLTPLTPAPDLGLFMIIYVRCSKEPVGYINPSVEEILCQIPEQYVNDTVAFSIGPGGMTIHFAPVFLEIHDDYRVATVFLYRAMRMPT